MCDPELFNCLKTAMPILRSDTSATSDNPHINRVLERTKKWRRMSPAQCKKYVAAGGDMTEEEASMLSELNPIEMGLEELKEMFDEDEGGVAKAYESAMARYMIEGYDESA